MRNFTARKHLKEMKKGDLAFFYHSGAERRIVGIVEVIRESYPDATDPKGVFVATDVKARSAAARAGDARRIKAAPRLKDMALVKYSRLSVQPVTPAEWTIVCKMGGVKEKRRKACHHAQQRIAFITPPRR